MRILEVGEITGAKKKKSGEHISLVSLSRLVR